MNERHSFIPTKQYALFKEFCDACAEYRYIGLCYGRPGVGKTLSARRYSQWDQISNVEFEPSGNQRFEYFSASEPLNAATIFYTPSVAMNSRTVYLELKALREKARLMSPEMISFNREREKLIAEAKKKRQREKAQYAAHVKDEALTVGELPSCFDFESDPKVYDLQSESYNLRKIIRDPTRLVIIDEAERLGAAALDQVRYIYDQGDIGLVLIGMPGLEKRLARHPQLSSRIGFVHHFDPLTPQQVCEVWHRLWESQPNTFVRDIDPDSMNTIIRTTRGNFRLLERLLTQISRVLGANNLSHITVEVIEVARENLVIGAA